MKAFLARMSPQKALGLYVGDRQLTLCHVAATPLGPVTLNQAQRPYEPEQLGPTLAELLQSFLGSRRRRVALGLGLPPLRVFFSTRPIRTTRKDASAQVLLHEVLQSPTHTLDDMVVDLIKAQPGQRKVASIVACRRKYLSGILSVLADRLVRVMRAEPAPFALLRAASLWRRTPRRVRTVVRLLLGEDRGLAVAVSAGLPILWRTFPLPAGKEVNTLMAAVRSVQTLLPHCGVESRLDAVILHGRPQLHAPVEQAIAATDAELRLYHAAGPGLDDESVALGLALGALNPAEAEFDLARSVKPRASLLEMFPWRELAVQVTLLACMVLFLFVRQQDLTDSYNAARAEANRRPALASLSEGDLQKEKKALEQKIEAVRRFLGSRVEWTPYAQDIADRLPEGVFLTSLTGNCDLELPSKGKVQTRGKKGFILKGSAPISRGGSTPREIDDFVNFLRGHAPLIREFPQVELADVRWSQSGTGPTGQAFASFTVVCMPKQDSKPARPSGSK